LKKKIVSTQSNSYGKNDYKREGKQVKEDPIRNLVKEKEGKKLREGSSSHTHTSNIKCFNCLGTSHIASQCPTKKTMILRVVDI